ncbi:MAG: hypothetical protein R8G66_02920 [Cytophagales bacterium]|nr:hypothetical protein [Cytophagales bacterium]
MNSDNNINPKMSVNVAAEPWVMEQLMDTERRIEKAFHEQTQYLSQQQALANDKLDNTVRWMVGLMITMIVALVAAIFLQPYI